MTISKTIRLVSSLLTLVGLALAVPECPLFVSRHFLWLPAFVSVMLAQSVFTGFCPMAIVLKAMGLKDDDAGAPAAP